MSSMIGMLKKNLNKKEKSLQAIDPKYYNSSSYNIQTLNSNHLYHGNTSSTYDARAHSHYGRTRARRVHRLVEAPLSGSGAVISVSCVSCELSKNILLRHVPELSVVEVVKVESMVHMGVKKWLLIITNL
jgi:hypothetical protein